MKRQSKVAFALLAFGFAGSLLAAQGQKVPEGQKVVVIRIGQLFNGKSDGLSSNQVIVVQGDRIADVGPAASVKVPAGAEQIDLGQATVLPGLIDGHHHAFKSASQGQGDPTRHLSKEYLTILAVENLKKDLQAGFTSAREMTSGSTADADLRDVINDGIVPGPRLKVTTQGIIGMDDGPEYFQRVFSPWEGRRAVRAQLNNGADFIKIYAAGVRFGPDRKPIARPTMTLEEQEAIVDEAHRQGVKVACTARGVAVRQSLEAGCDSIEMATVLDDESIRIAVAKGTFMNFALAQNRFNSPTHAEFSKGSFQRALKAGVKIVVGVNATGGRPNKPGRYHGEEAAEFAFMVEYGMTPLQAMRAGTSVGAENMGVQDQLGSIEKGKYADLIAVSGNPAKDITELQRVKFVMKGGQIVRDDLSPKARSLTTASSGLN